MLQNLPEGETDESYDKTINLRELKKPSSVFSESLLTHFVCTRKSELRTSAVRGFHVYLDIWLTDNSMIRQNACMSLEVLMMYFQVHKRKHDCWASS